MHLLFCLFKPTQPMSVCYGTALVCYYASMSIKNVGKQQFHVIFFSVQYTVATVP